MARKFPPVYPHGELEELFADLWFITGSVKMPGPLPMRFSRNMVVVRQGRELTLINTMRLDDEGLAALDTLGEVKHLIRLAGFHGMDDPFYKDRYGAKVWVVKGQSYAKGFTNPKTKPEDGYFSPDVEMDASTELPIAGAELITLECLAGEGLIFLDRDGGIIVAGDSLQNWASTNRYFSLAAKALMKLIGFIKPHNVGPGWVKQSKPKLEQLAAVLDREFDHLLPVHGDAVIGDAKEKFRPAIERVCG